MIKAIIFDCFGVITTDALQLLHGELEARNPAAAADVRSLIQAANRGIIAPAESSSKVSKLLGMTVPEYRQAIIGREVRNQPLLDYIPTLRKEYKTAMLSNITKQGIERRFPNNELDHYFDVVVISSEIGFAKPDSEAYEITAERLGVAPSECVFTDDRTEFCNAAETVGMQAIEFRNFEQFKTELDQLLTV